VKEFEFEDAGRIFSCFVEKQSAAHPQDWWWFTVSNVTRNRYAPFRAESTDTKANVQSRILAYHEELLAGRARPRTTSWQRQRPAGATATPAAAPSADATTVDSEG
jgi:hypothetical protein